MVEEASKCCVSAFWEPLDVALKSESYFHCTLCTKNSEEPVVYPVSGLHLPTSLADSGLDAVDVVAYVHPIGDRPLVVVLGYEILVEKAERLFGRCSGKAHEEGVEVV